MKEGSKLLQEILLLANGYPNLEQSQKAAFSLAKNGRREIIALYIINSAWDDILGDEWISDGKTLKEFHIYFEAGLRRRAETALEDIRSKGTGNNVKVHGTIQRGNPEKLILSACARLGTEGVFILPLLPKSAGERIRVNAKKLVNQTSCPILLMPELKKHQDNN